MFEGFIINKQKQYLKKGINHPFHINTDKKPIDIDNADDVYITWNKTECCYVYACFIEQETDPDEIKMRSITSSILCLSMIVFIQGKTIYLVKHVCLFFGLPENPLFYYCCGFVKWSWVYLKKKLHI